MSLLNYKAEHFNYEVKDGVAIISLTDAKRKNPLTFDSYAELRDYFYKLAHDTDVKAVMFTSNEGNFCSGGDVKDIIGPLVQMDMTGLLNFTRMTGDLVKAMIKCKTPIIAAIDGICVGAGAIVAMASDMRIATDRAKTAFLFTRVGLGACDMGACAILPRIIGQGRASELLFTGRNMSADEGDRWGFYNKVVEVDALENEAFGLAKSLADGPNFGHMMTKTMLDQEWAMSLDAAIESEAQAQAICMQTKDFERAYNAFMNKERPEFMGD